MLFSTCGPPTRVADVVCLSMKPPSPSPAHTPLHLETGMDAPSPLVTLSPFLIPVKSTHLLCDVCPFDFNFCALLASKYPDKPQGTWASLLVFSTNPLSIYSCLLLTQKASLSAPWAKFQLHPEPLDLVLLTYPESWQRDQWETKSFL